MAQLKYSQDHLYVKGEMSLRQNTTLMYVIVFTWFERGLVCFSNAFFIHFCLELISIDPSSPERIDRGQNVVLSSYERATIASTCDRAWQ